MRQSKTIHKNILSVVTDHFTMVHHVRLTSTNIKHFAGKLLQYKTIQILYKYARFRNIYQSYQIKYNTQYTSTHDSRAWKSQQTPYIIKHTQYATVSPRTCSCKYSFITQQISYIYILIKRQFHTHTYIYIYLNKNSDKSPNHENWPVLCCGSFGAQDEMVKSIG